jgi:hypothetical protein
MQAWQLPYYYIAPYSDMVILTATSPFHYKKKSKINPGSNPPSNQIILYRSIILTHFPCPKICSCCTWNLSGSLVEQIACRYYRGVKQQQEQELVQQQ